MDKKLRGIAEIVIAILIVAASLYFSTEVGMLREFGYAGVFLISMASAATLFFPAPGWASVVAMSTVLDPYLVGIAAGVGAAIGELTGYVAGDGARKMIESRVKDYKKYRDIIEKYDFAGIFVLAFIPNPLFDIAGIIAGSLKMHPVKYLAACALGRTLRYILLAYVGAIALDFIA
ncbi:MAG: VTT domain-containing protein [Candidatus Micrarchaeota archaeon]